MVWHGKRSEATPQRPTRQPTGESGSQRTTPQNDRRVVLVILRAMCSGKTKPPEPPRKLVSGAFGGLRLWVSWATNLQKGKRARGFACTDQARRAARVVG